MSTYSIAEIREQILNENLSLKDIVTDYIATIEDQASEINAFVSTYFEEPLSEEEKIEKKIKNGTAGSLEGAVLGIKDLICERGRQATCSPEILDDFESV